MIHDRPMDHFIQTSDDSSMAELKYRIYEAKRISRYHFLYLMTMANNN